MKAMMCAAMAGILPLACSANGESPALFPRPKEVAWAKGPPLILPDGKTAILIGDSAMEPEQYAAEALRRYVQKRFGRNWPVLCEGSDSGAYRFVVLLGQRTTSKMVDRLCSKWKVDLSEESPGHDGYIIQFGKDGGREIAMVGGSTPRGVVYGQDTLFQLIVEQTARGTYVTKQDGQDVYLHQEHSSLAFHPAKIRDWPSIPWRGRPHSDITGYDRPNTFDAFAQARVNFIDLRLGTRIYGTPPGFKIDKEKVAHVVREGHRRGFFIFATVDCAVAKDKYDDVVKTYEEFLALGADGIYISIDDPGADFRMGTSIELLTRIVELGKKHGITGQKLAMVPGKESYVEIATPTNYKVGHTPGMERVLLFATVPPTPENHQKAIECGFKSPPAWWLNWPRPRGGFTHAGNANRRAGGKQAYMDLSPLSEGWWTPSWDLVREAGKHCGGVHPWGASIWGAEYVAHVLNLWAWAPELHDWTEERRRMYDIVFGPDMVEAAFEFDDLHLALRNLFVVSPDYPGQGKAGGLSAWPPILRSESDRAKAHEIIEQIEDPLRQLEQGAAAGSLLDADQLHAYYIEPMRASVEIAEIMTDLPHPDYWWKAHEERVLTAIRAGNLKQAREWQTAAKERVQRETQRVTEALEGLVMLEDYPRQWLARVDSTIAEARRADRPITMKGDLSDPLWATAPKLGGFGSGAAPAEDPTEAQILYDDKALYIGFTCHESIMDRLTCERTSRDSNVWLDDSVEVFINTDGLLVPYFQFIANAAGVEFDGCQTRDSEFDISWNGEWDVKTARFDDRWTAELRIPFATIGVSGSQQGRIWMCNFARNDHANDRVEKQGWAEYETSSYGAEPRSILHDTRKLRPVWFK